MIDWMCDVNIFTLVIFTGFSPQLWAEGAPVQDSCRVPHRRAHTNKCHCPCTGWCRNAVTLLPPTPTITMIIIISVLFFSTHTVLTLPQTEWAVLSLSSKFCKCCSPPPFLSRQWLLKVWFSSMQTFQGTRPPQFCCISIIFAMRKCFLSVLWLCFTITWLRGRLPFTLLSPKEALYSLNLLLTRECELIRKCVWTHGAKLICLLRDYLQAN